MIKQRAELLLHTKLSDDISTIGAEEILRMAAAAGTAAVTTSGTNLFYRDKYNEIYSKIYSERIY